MAKNRVCSTCGHAKTLAEFPTLKQGPKAGKPGKVCTHCRRIAAKADAKRKRAIAAKANGAAVVERQPEAIPGAVLDLPGTVLDQIVERAADKLADRIERKLAR